MHFNGDGADGSWELCTTALLCKGQLTALGCRRERKIGFTKLCRKKNVSGKKCEDTTATLDTGGNVSLGLDSNRKR